jgi:hypothetical protein
VHIRRCDYHKKCWADFCSDSLNKFKFKALPVKLHFNSLGGMGRRRRWLLQRKLEKRFERDPVIDLALQLRLGLDIEPFLEKGAFKQKQRGDKLVHFFWFFQFAKVSKEALGPAPNQWWH